LFCEFCSIDSQGEICPKCGLNFSTGAKEQVPWLNSKLKHKPGFEKMLRRAGLNRTLLTLIERRLRSETLYTLPPEVPNRANWRNFVLNNFLRHEINKIVAELREYRKVLEESLDDFTVFKSFVSEELAPEICHSLGAKPEIFNEYLRYRRWATEEIISPVWQRQHREFNSKKLLAYSIDLRGELTKFKELEPKTLLNVIPSVGESSLPREAFHVARSWPKRW
jgi:hypothetical protein